LESLFKKHGFFENKKENDYLIQFPQFHSFINELHQLVFVAEHSEGGENDDDNGDDDKEEDDDENDNTALSDDEIKDLVL
jgi:hypothetical protein